VPPFTIVTWTSGSEGTTGAPHRHAEAMMRSHVSGEIMGGEHPGGEHLGGENLGGERVSDEPARAAW